MVGEQFCSCHSGVKKQLEGIEREGRENHESVGRAHSRIDEVEKSKVPYWILGLLVVVFVGLFGYQSSKLEKLDNIDKGVAVLKSEVENVKRAIGRLEQ